MDSDENRPAGSPPASAHKHQTDLLSSAKVLTAAAQSAFTKKGTVDTSEAAGAAEDLLSKAEEYGKLDQTAYGQYVDKAEDYLHGMSTKKAAPHSDYSKTSDQEQTEAGSGGGGVMKKAQGFTKSQSVDDGDSKASDDKPSESEEGGGGIGGYMKMAQGFLK